jgi:hypothetical protein
MSGEGEIFCLIETGEAPDGALCLGHGPNLAERDHNLKLTLVDAAKISGLTEAALRTEAAKGTLVISRIAKKDFTTLAEIERMFEQCRVPAKESVYGLEQPAATQAEKSRMPPIGKSKTAEDDLALDAALMRARKLKEGLPTTSPANTRRNAGNVRYLKSK